MSREIKWKNNGGPFLTKDRKTIAPKGTFKAKPEDIPKGFRDVIIPLEEIPSEKDELVESVSKYEIVAKGIGWFNVKETESGNIITEKPLRKKEALALIESLS